MKQTDILVIFTGGTIGSGEKEGYLSPAGEQARGKLLSAFRERKQDEYEKRFQTKIHFKTRCPYEILSENLNGSHLPLLWDALKDVDGYDGIILTVGTDTLAYSSAMAGYLFGDLGIPVVTVSSNHPLEDEESNGYDNFAGAVLLILEGIHKGVFCSYQNRERHVIHYGTRLLLQGNYEDEVISVKNSCYGEICENKKGYQEIVLNPEVKKESVKHKDESLEEKQLISEMQSGVGNLTKSPVCFLRPYPGMVFPDPAGYKGILLDTYHSGTFPVKDGFSEFIQKAKAANVPVCVAGVPEGTVYETVAEYQKEGAMILPVAAPVAMYCKLWLLCSAGISVEKMAVPVGSDIL
ncbi:MAG: asparaginase [Lachnospiraceae bacterium]|nr:asparaginase [Lachnospiraceae bacterium]